MTRSSVLIAFMLGLSACTSWPDDGTGGFAERRAIADPALEQLAHRFARQRSNGADQFAAGATDEAKTLFVRAQRHHAAGLYDDACLDLNRLSSLLDSIDHQIKKR